MSSYQTVPTSFVTVNDLKIAYRRLGKQGGFPLVFINHLRGSMDTIDPLFVNSIAKNREIILFDNAGIGHSEGEVPDSIQGMALIAVNLLANINVPKADIIGFSMGGGTAQYIAMEYPHLVNKVILAGTQPGVGEGVVLPPREILENSAAGLDQEPTEENMLMLFFYPSATSQALGHAWSQRLFEREVGGEKRAGYLVGAGVLAQLSAISKFAGDAAMYAALGKIKAPVLVTNGHTDVMSPTVNSYVLQQKLANAHLHIYPDAGHGHLFQFPEVYAKNLEVFLGS